MSMKRYKLSFLPLFESDLIKITDYITNHLNNPEAALGLVYDIETAINRRLETPLAFASYPTSKNRLYPYYRINIRNLSVFSVVIGETMEVRRVLYAKSNIDNLLR